MIKEVLQQLEPLDAQIDALCSRADDAEMASTTTHAAELAELSAEENVVNSLAAGFYREHGVRRIEPGFDAGPIPEGCRVMRTRYCLRRETGQCLRKNPAYRGRLFLASGRHVYELLFDCARCEMSVVYRGERGEPAREEGARRERKPGRSRR